MAKLSGVIRPLGDKILIFDMEFGMETSKGGILLQSDDGKSQGIHPRWAKVFAVGPDQQDVKEGEWILLEHARWTRGIKYETDSGEEIMIRMADNKAILLIGDQKPDDTMRQTAVGAGSNFNFNIPGA